MAQSADRSNGIRTTLSRAVKDEGWNESGIKEIRFGRKEAVLCVYRQLDPGEPPLACLIEFLPHVVQVLKYLR